MRSGLTLLCITRDEAPKLMRLLQSFQGVADEMVVVDTGSKDLSPGVARMAGARLYEIEWPGSFADAMNFAISQVETEWTVRLDTDEWLLEDSGPLLRRAMTEPRAVGYNLLREDVVDDSVTSEAYQLRMWRTDPRLRFEGLIHERVPPEVLREVIGDRKIYNLPARFRHDGYEGGVSCEKLRRNVDLLRRELAERPGELYYEIDLIQSLIKLGDPEGGAMLRTLLMAVVAKPRQDPHLADLYIVALRQGIDVERIAAIALNSFPDHPAVLWAVALAEHARGRLGQSAIPLKRLSDLMRNTELMRAHGMQSDAQTAVEAMLREVTAQANGS